MTINIAQRDHSGWESLPEKWPEILRKILAARGIQAESDLSYDLADLPKPELMMGMTEAAQLIAQAVIDQQHIMIVADFDTDGATSCAVAIRSLRSMGAKQVDYIVPNRFTHGYGLTPELLAEIPENGQPDLLLTVDNGIASVAGVDVANQRGIKVVVTDHHLPGDVLPNADAIVNPNQQGDTFPSKNLAGVGVCFYVMLAIRQCLRQQDWFSQQSITEPNLTTLLDLVALGTVADVVPLDKLNRTWVTRGLTRIHAGKSCAGINALIRVSGRDSATLSSLDLGFSIAPRLNAAGRLDNMSIGIETLLTDDVASAESSASLLDDINKQRRSVEQDMQEQANLMLANMSLDESERPLGYCMYNEQWHQGVIGLLASRIKEKQHRPVIAFAKGNEGEIKGSARSIVGIHIRDVLALVAAQAPDILSKFGGHAMAAGLTIASEDLDRFEAHFLSAVQKIVNPEVFQQIFYSDGELATGNFSLELALLLANSGPWGQSFPEPRFHGKFTIQDIRTVGQQHEHLRLTLALDNGKTITAMAFRQIQPEWLAAGIEAVLYYRLSINEFRQQQSVQLLVDKLLPAESSVKT